MKKLLKNILLVTALVISITINVNAKDGWIEEKDNKYYIENDEKITGFKVIDDKKYFFSMYSKTLKYGWQGMDGNTWYQDEDGVVVTGLQEIDGNIYLFNDEGYMQKGFIDKDDKTYFFSKVNGALKHGWQGMDGKSWYQDEDGAVVKGIQEIEGNKYYFGEDGFRKDGFIELNSKLYFFSKVNGALKQGWQGMDGHIWYQNEDGEVLKGWQEIEGKKYYFDNNGFRLDGFQTIDNKLYFFSKINGALKTGWQSSDGKRWLQDENGVVKTNTWYEENGLKFYFDKDGTQAKGFTYIGENRYFFSNYNYALKYGWQGMDGEYWYQDNEGKLVTGIHTIDNRDYAFNNYGILQGFKNENGKLYYTNPDGTQAKGVEYMIGQFWKFNEVNGEFEKIVKQVRAIDVSQHQGIIDWDKVKASGKVDAVILRLGYGTQWIDKQFLRNVNELNRLGIPYSVYLFSYAENAKESKMESDFVINTIKKNTNVNIASNIFSIYYDLEDWYISSTGESSNNISKENYGEMITTFIDNTEKNLCVKTRVYASKNYIQERFPESVQHYATWVAQWAPVLTYTGPYEGWQYSDNGSIPGINGPVDLNVFYY